MRILLIAGQDIRYARFGIAEDDKILFEERVEGEPHTFLKSMTELLSDWKVNRQDIEAVAVASGPGSSTALRVSVTLANTFGFALNIPVFTAKAEVDAPLKELLAQIDQTKPTLATPEYNFPPNVTKPLPKNG